MTKRYSNEHIELCDSVERPRYCVDAAVTIKAEPIELTRKCDFCLGSAIRHIFRAECDAGDRLEELRKARWYLQEERRVVNERFGSYIDLHLSRIEQLVLATFMVRFPLINALFESDGEEGQYDDDGLLKCLHMLDGLIEQESRKKNGGEEP